MKKLIFGALALGVVGAANAQVLISENFDGMVDGNLDTQNGWIALTGAGSTYNVVSGAGLAGSKGVVFAEGSTGGNFAWKDIVPVYDGAASSNKLVRARTDVFVGSNAGLLGRGGLRAYTALGATIVSGGYFRSDGNLYNGNGAVLLGSNAAWMNTWVSLEVRMNFAAANYTVLVNGVQVGAAQALGSTTLEDVDFFNSNSVGAADIKYDNFKVEAVPEPGSILALGLGAVALMRRRRA